MTSTLLIIDVQRAFDHPSWGERNNPGAETRIAELLAAWRGAGAPLIHVRHRSPSPGGLFAGEGLEPKAEGVALDGEEIIEKNVNSAFIGTDLEQRLRARGAESVVIAGLTTDHCCSTTARMAGNLGFQVWFADDATATFARTAPDGTRFSADTMHRTAVASLSGEFAEIRTAGELVATLLGP
jgi:nicotinamidase-related amidase